jgi:hypothetical protein
LILASIGGDQGTICEDDFGFEDLLDAKSIITGCWRVSSTLCPAPNGAYCLSKINMENQWLDKKTYRITTTDYYHVFFFGLGIDLFPDITSSNLKSTSIPYRFPTGVGGSITFFESYALPKIPYPQF